MKSFSSKIVVLVVFVLVFSMLPISSLLNISKAAEPTPVFTDSFEKKLNTSSSLTSNSFNETVKSSNKVSYVGGKSGSGVHLDSVSSYVGYSSKYINPEEGTIRFYFKPDSNIYTFYNTRQTEWKDYGSNKPPFSGYMIDTVGYLSAFDGAFSASINFSGDKNNKNTSIIFQTYNVDWSLAKFTTKNDFVLSSDKFYDFAFTWSKRDGAIKIYIDGALKATSKYNTPLNNKELFFIGQNPFKNYWPYGPHSLIGTYDELRIYNTALKDFGTSTPQNPTPQETPTGTTIIKLVVGKSAFTVNGKSKTLDSPPVIKNGRTLLPIRPVIESLGGTVAWDSATRKVTIKLGSTTIELWIDKKNAKVNGVTKTLDVAPQIINGRTMVPVRFVSENLGAKVDWDDKTKTITITYSGGTVAGAVEKTFTSSGGELILSDGTKLTVPAGAFSSDTKISMKDTVNPPFSGVDTTGVEITGLKALKGEINLSVNIKKNLKNEELNVFGYDHDKDEKIDFKYNYEPNTGTVTVKISPSAYSQSNEQYHLLSNDTAQTHAIGQSYLDKLSVYVGWVPYYTAKSSEKIIRTPYYSQIGNSCATTCAQMLLKKSDYDAELFSVLKNVQASDTDFGLDADQYAYTLKDYLSSKTGYPVIHIPYFGIPHLKWRVLEELDKGHPVILNLGVHVILIVGYTDNGNSLIVHDPQDVSPANNENGTMYTVRSWDWIKSRHEFKTEKYLILYADGSFATGTNVTVECPGKSENGGMQGGDLSFYALNASNKLFAKYGLQIKPSATDGYIWTNASKDKVNYIGTDAETLSLSIPIFNASDRDRTAEVKVAIEEDNGSGAPGKTIASYEQKYSMGAAKLNTASKAIYEHDFKMEDIRNLNLSDSNGKQKIFIHAYLHVDGDTKTTDSFMVKATLDVMPKVTSISPTSGKVGDTITINGYGFGKAKSTKSRVTINGKKVDIVSWSDKVIKVKLTQDTGSGPVVVYTGEKYEYKSNDNVVFTTKTEAKCEGVYRLNIFDIPKISIDGERDILSYVPAMYLTLKNGTIKAFHVEEQTSYYSEEASGTYDSKGNITFTLTIHREEDDHSKGLVYTGTFTGKFDTSSCKFEGKAQLKVRNYFKGDPWWPAFDITENATCDCEGALLHP